MTARFVALLALACALLVPMPAAAQIDDTSWGITGGFSPQWAVPGDWLAGLFDAKTIDVKGPEFRLGIVRGTTLGGEWGVSLVHKRLSKQSTVAVEGSNDVLTVVASDAEMLGVEAHRFFPFARVHKVQIGVNLGGGMAQLRGFVTGAYVGTTSTNFTLPFSDALGVTRREIDWIPIGRAELAAATLVGERLKVRVSGGFNMPGFQVVSLSFSYLLGQDK
jgi:phage antirepressor YoqD-like protein